jgi:hypothetical protein
MRILFVLATALMLAGCSKESPAPKPKLQSAPAAHSPMEEALARARALDTARDRMRAVPGSFTDGDASARYVAYWDGGVLRLIDERSDFGAYGSSAARYYLDTTGKLFLYEAQDARTATDPSSPGAKENVELRLVFDPDSRMLASDKKIDGKVQPAQATEIEGVRRHLEQLRSAVSAR